MRDLLLTGSLLVLFFLLSAALVAQPYGNEWINPDQEYYRMEVDEDGVYKITYEDLDEAGVDVNSINHENFSLYWRGEEQPLHLVSDDGNFNAGDYFIFYGQRNDGQLDALLYDDPDHQPHPYKSFFTDKSIYFLTWNPSEPRLRYTETDQSDLQNHSPADWYWEEEVKWWADDYYDAWRPEFLHISYYQDTEGYHGSTFSQGRNRSAHFNTDNFYEGGHSSSFEAKVLGKSDESSDDPNYNHHVEIEGRSGGSGSYSFLTSKKFSGYTGVTIDEEFDLALMDDNEFTLRFNNVDDLGAEGSDMALAYATLRFPARPDLNGDWFREITAPASKSYPLRYTFDNYSSAHEEPFILDPEGGEIILPDRSNNQLDFLVESESEGNELIISDKGELEPLSPTANPMKDYGNLIDEGLEYLILTHESLTSSAEAFADYREETGYNTEVVYSHDLYDQFLYGHPSPISIRQFAKHLISEGKKPDHVLLLGQGLQRSMIQDPWEDNMVPTMGTPGADNQIFAGIDVPELELPFGVGRLPAFNNEMVNIYLDKLKEHNEAPPEPWKKNVMHLAGGGDQSENQLYEDFLGDMEPFIKNAPLGGDVINISKTEASPVDKSLREKIIELYNEGVSFSNYFGHGSANVLEIDIGQPDEYDNQGRYPVMNYNGCIMGNYYIGGSRGENFIFEPEAGAIGWFAASETSFQMQLYDFSMSLTEQIFQDNFGETFSEIHQGTLRDYKQPGNIYNEMQLMQTNFMGCPALVMHDIEKADYSVEEDGIRAIPEEPDLADEAFTLEVAVENHGLVKEDTLNLLIERTYPDRTTKTYPLKQVQAPFNKDTFGFDIPNEEEMNKVLGTNQFTVTVNPDSTLEESNYDNNTATKEVNFGGSGAAAIWPPDLGIVGDNEVTLTAQSLDLFMDSTRWFFEIDTVASFTSPWKQRSDVQLCAETCHWDVELPDWGDSTAFYWRVRIDSEDELASQWSIKSFTYLKGQKDGWSQAHFDQLQKNQLDSIFADPEAQSLRYNKEPTNNIEIRAHGPGAEDFDRRIELNISNPAWTSTWYSDGLAIIGINPFHMIEGNPNREPMVMNRYNPESQFNQNSPNHPRHTWNREFQRNSGVMFFRWLSGDEIDTAVVDSAIEYLNNVPENYLILGALGDGHKMADMPERLYEALDQYNLTKHRQIPNNFPYIFTGDRTGEHVMEETADTINSTIPPHEQMVNINTFFDLPYTTGQMMSHRIGPSQQWRYFSSNIPKKQNDSVAFQISGVNEHGEDSLLTPWFTEAQKDISHIDTEEFPYLRIAARLTNDSTRIPPDLSLWNIHHDHPPEGGIVPHKGYDYDSDTVKRGKPITVNLPYQNLSNYGFDSITVKTRIRSLQSREVLWEKDTVLPPLKPGKITRLKDTIPTSSLEGRYRVEITFNPVEPHQQLYEFNNRFIREVEIEDTSFPPQLEILVDDKNIPDNEIVSNSPEIKTRAYYNNPWMPIKHPDHLQLSIQREGGAEINLGFQRGDVQFVAAQGKDTKTRGLYTPSKLKPGKYTFRAKAYAPTGDSTKSTTKKQTFRVIEENRVTPFYPKPNPFRDEVTFRYKVSGEKPPEKVEMRIYDITGREVKTLTHGDLGAPKMGRNKTIKGWDGTDERGQRVSPGLYYYTVRVLWNGRWEEPKTSEIDPWRENLNYGKIILKRK